MLKYNYTYLMIGIIILLIVPIALYLLFPHHTMYPFVFVWFWCVFCIKKYCNRVKIEKDKLVIINFLYKREISYVDIKGIAIMKVSSWPVETTKLRIIRNTSKDNWVHLGILPYKENIDLLITLLGQYLKCSIVE